MQIRYIDSTGPDKTLFPLTSPRHLAGSWLGGLASDAGVKAWGDGEWRAGTLGFVAERGSVDEGVVLAARTIGALCMRAESSMHFLSSEATTTCLLRYSDDLAVASRKAGTCEYAFATGKNCDAAGVCVTVYFGMLYGIPSLEKRWTGRAMKVL